MRASYERLKIDTLLEQHLGLRIVPSPGEELILGGKVQFTATGPGGREIMDEYDLELRIPPTFPDDEPLVRETAGRIARDYHKLKGNHLCLASPTRIRIGLAQSPDVPAFVRQFVIPYLYGHSYHEKNGTMPFGELAHGPEGIREDLASLFGAPGASLPEEFIRLAGMQKRRANKEACPCGSGRRLGRCHNCSVNDLRAKLGRKWFDREYARIVNLFASME
ncbi:SEC-C metal-binding domain-containing protein [Symmachiella dynata]|uniref:SEC-C metal-binding domain-containing protein n=1 Tax=Symmachiella dynata TaxID=2527995 RepID=UPI0030EF6C1B